MHRPVGRTHALLMILDGLPARAVGPLATPVLDRLAVDGGGWVPDGGRAVMTTSAAPNLASFATGTTPNRHGIPAAQVPVGHGTDAVDADQYGPCVPSVFDALAGAGRSTAVVAADGRVVGLLGAGGADELHVGARGRGPGTPIDEVAAADDEVTDALVELLADGPDLVVGHLRLPDAAAHELGPDAPEAHDRYRETDRRVGRVLDALRGEWDDWVVVVVSDHDQEPVLAGREPVDLECRLERAGPALRVLYSGGAALVLGPDHGQGRWLAEVAGVAGSIELGPGVRLVWARPGRVLGPAEQPLARSVHGGPGATAQVAVVGGGHPAVARIAASMDRRSPAAADWAVTVAELFATPLPTATGRSLLAWRTPQPHPHRSGGSR